MGMGAEVEGFRMSLHLPDLNAIYIPRRRRGSSGAVKKEQPKTEIELPLTMLEAAVILIEMANSVSEIEPEKFNNSHKRKRPLTELPLTMLEAAAILIEMPNSVSDIEPEKFNNSHKRKRPLTPTPTTNSKKQRKKKAKQSEYPSIPEMPAAMRDRIVEMGGYEIRLVIQKQLQYTDLNKNHGRLSLPAKKLLFDFATEEETKLLSEQENKNKKGMNVLIVDDVLEERMICLKKWKIGSGDVYCLMTQWNSLVEETGLKSGQHIQLWCFRKNDEFEAARLCFAMVKLAAC